MLLLLSRFSRVRLCVTLWKAAHQAPLSLGFSRQEHWSGLPFPFPVHEGEKWKWSRSVVSNSSRPHGLQPTRFLHPWDLPGKSTGVGCHCLLRTSKWLNLKWVMLKKVRQKKSTRVWFCLYKSLEVANKLGPWQNQICGYLEWVWEMKWDLMDYIREWKCLLTWLWLWGMVPWV